MASSGAQQHLCATGTHFTFLNTLINMGMNNDPIYTVNVKYVLYIYYWKSISNSSGIHTTTRAEHIKIPFYS